MLRTRPVRSHLHGTASTLAPDEDGALEQHDDFRVYGERAAPWSASLPTDVLQELLKQQMAVAYRPPGERARVLMASRVWEHLRRNADAAQVVQHIVALDLHELQSIWTGLAG